MTPNFFIGFFAFLSDTCKGTDCQEKDAKEEGELDLI
jgi:hypothetical protein